MQTICDHFFSMGEFENAISCLYRLLEKDPENISIYIKMAHANISLGNKAEAILWSNRALSLEGRSDKDFLFFQGEALMIIGGQTNNAHLFALAIKYFDEVLDIDSGYEFAFIDRCWAFYYLIVLENKRDMFDQALAGLEALPRIHPENPALLFQVAEACLSLGELVGDCRKILLALNYFELYVLQQPDALFYRSKVYYCLGVLGRLTGAEIYFHRSIDEINRELALGYLPVDLLHFNKSVTFVSLFKITDDIKYMKQAIECAELVSTGSRWEGGALRNAAIGYCQVGRCFKDREAFRKSILLSYKAIRVVSTQEEKEELYFNVCDCYRLIGVIFNESGHLLHSERILKRMLEKNKNLGLVYYELGVVYTDLFYLEGDVDRYIDAAVENFSIVISQRANLPDVHTEILRLGIRIVEKGIQSNSVNIPLQLLHCLYKCPESIDFEVSILVYLLQLEEAPHLISLFVKTFPHLLTHSQFCHHIQELLNKYRVKLGELNATLQALRSSVDAQMYISQTYLYRSIWNYWGGDPFASYLIIEKYFREIDNRNPRKHYYLCLSAAHTQHPAFNSILSNSLSYLEGILPSVDHLYYAALLYLWSDNAQKGESWLRELAQQYDYLPAWFKLLEYYYHADSEKFRQTVELAFKKGLLDEINANKIISDPVKAFERKIMLCECEAGIFYMEKYAEDRFEEKENIDIPRSRSKYYYNEDRVIIRDVPSVSELFDLDPLRKEKLEEWCKIHMEHLYEKYCDCFAGDIHDELLAEALHDSLLDEFDLGLKIEFKDYLMFLEWLCVTRRITVTDYILISTFNGLKCASLNKGKGQELDQIVLGLVIRQVASAAADFLGGCVPGLPVKKLYELLKGHDASDIINLNYKHFKKRYDSIVGSEASELVEILNSSTVLEEVKDFIDESHELFG